MVLKLNLKLKNNHNKCIIIIIYLCPYTKKRTGLSSVWELQLICAKYELQQHFHSYKKRSASVEAVTLLAAFA